MNLEHLYDFAWCAHCQEWFSLRELQICSNCGNEPKVRASEQVFTSESATTEADEA